MALRPMAPHPSDRFFAGRCSVALAALSFIAFVGAGCSPRVEVTPSDKPITINMNVKIDHEVRVKVERDLEQVINKDSDLF